MVSALGGHSLALEVSPPTPLNDGTNIGLASRSSYGYYSEGYPILVCHKRLFQDELCQQKRIRLATFHANCLTHDCRLITP